MIPRIQALAENPDIATETRAPMIEAFEKYQRDLSARQYVEDFLDAAERHMNTHASLQRVADRLGVRIVKVSDHLGWRQEADRLMAVAETVLGDAETYGVHLDNMETGHAQVKRELSRLRQVIREDGEYAAAGKKPEPRSEPADTREKVEQPEPADPAWMPAYEALRQDWNSLIEDTRKAGIPLFYAKGYMDIVVRVQTIAENPDIPAKSRAPLIQVLENHQHYLSTRKQILEYPGKAQWQMDARASLHDVAADRENELTGVSAYPDWRHEAERLTAAGEAILSGKETYGAHLDRLVDARMFVVRALSALREVIRVDDKELAEREARELRRLQNRHWVGPQFASVDGAPDPGQVGTIGAEPVRAAFSRFGRAVGHLVGGQGYHDRLRTATFAREVLQRSQVLKRDWNRQVERAAEDGVHVIYTDGYDRLHKELDSVSKNMLLDRGVESEISTVLAQIGKVVSNRNYFDDCREHMAGQMDRREALAAKAAERGVAVPDYEDYDTWRDVTDFAVGRCEELMDDPGNYGIHLDYIALRKKASAQRSHGCATCLKTTTGTSRQPWQDNARVRASRCATNASPASSTIRRNSGSCGNSAPSVRPKGSSRARADIGACECSPAMRGIPRAARMTPSHSNEKAPPSVRIGEGRRSSNLPDHAVCADSAASMLTSSSQFETSAVVVSNQEKLPMAVEFSKWPSDDTRIIVRRMGEYIGCIRKGKNGWLPSLNLSAAMNGTDDNRSRTVWRNRHVATEEVRKVLS